MFVYREAIHSSSMSQDCGHIAPLAPRAQHVIDPPQSLLATLATPIHNFAPIDLALAAIMFGRGNQRFDMRPFLASQVARIAAFVTLEFRAVRGRPHRRPLLEPGRTPGANPMTCMLIEILNQILRRRVFDRASTANPSPPTATSDFVKPYTISLWIDEVGKSAANCLR